VTLKGLEDLEDASSALESGPKRIWVETLNPLSQLTGHFVEDKEIYMLLEGFLTFNALLGKKLLQELPDWGF
jgi:hypothetical protein